jgi:transcriptional regulator with XRE-family HTH domain
MSEEEKKRLCQKLVSYNVRRIRRALDLSQHELATESGITRAYIGRLESRGQNLTLDTVCALAQALGVHPRELFAPIGDEE